MGGIIMNNLKANISNIIAELVETELTESDLDLPINEIGVDSLMALEIAVYLERDFNVYLSEKDLEEIVSVNGLISMVTSRMEY